MSPTDPPTSLCLAASSPVNPCPAGARIFPCQPLALRGPHLPLSTPAPPEPVSSPAPPWPAGALACRRASHSTALAPSAPLSRAEPLALPAPHRPGPSPLLSGPDPCPLRRAGPRGSGPRESRPAPASRPEPARGVSRLRRPRAGGRGIYGTIFIGRSGERLVLLVSSLTRLPRPALPLRASAVRPGDTQRRTLTGLDCSSRASGARPSVP